MKLSEVRNRLISLRLIEALPPETQLRVAMLLLWTSKLHSLAADYPIYKQGEKDDNTGCVLLEGKVRIAPASDGGEALEIEGPELLGEMQQLSKEQVRTATVTTVTGATVLVFYWHDFVLGAALILKHEEQLALKHEIEKMATARFMRLEE